MVQMFVIFVFRFADLKLLLNQFLPLCRSINDLRSGVQHGPVVVRQEHLQVPCAVVSFALLNTAVENGNKT